MRSAASSSLSPRSTAATAWASGAVAVEPSRRGKFSRVKLMTSPSGVAPGVDAGVREAPQAARAKTIASARAAQKSFRIM